MLDIDLARHKVDRDDVNFNSHVRCTLIKGRMSRWGDNPTPNKSTKCNTSWPHELLHLGFRDTFDGPCPVSVCLDGHDNRLRTAWSGRTSTIGIVIES